MKAYFTSFVGILLYFSLSINAYSQCYELVWADEFDYTGLPDNTKWKYDVGGGGWGNNELQYYTDKRIENAGVADGILTITAIKESYGGRDYTSARLVSTGEGSWLYGKIEIKAKLPGGKGAWAALWMLPTDWEYGGWPSSGEIDIMEYVGYDFGNVHSTIHTEAFNHSIGTQKGAAKFIATAESDYHVYAVSWTPDKMIFSIDGVNFFLFSNHWSYDYEEWPFDKRFHMIMNIAVGGNWGGQQGVDPAAFPMIMDIDYVRVYQDVALAKIEGNSTIVSKGQKGLEFSLAQVEGRSFQWSVPEDAIILSKPDSNAIAVDWGCTSGEVSCILSTICDTVELSFPVEVKDTEIEGDLFFKGTEDILNFSAPQINNASYSWIVPADAEIVSRLDSNAVEIKWGSTPGLVELEINSICGTEILSKEVFAYGQYPYPDPQKPAIIPGIINPVNYDYGGEAIAYHDAETRNQGTGPRQDEGVDTQYNDGGENVGWIVSGEWLEYTIKVEAEGMYHLNIRVASASTATRGPLTVKFNGVNQNGGISIPSTGNWGVFTNVSTYVYLSPEDTLMRLEAGNGNFNIGNLTFSSAIGIEDNMMNFNSELLLYPNPVEETLYLHFKDENNFVPGKIMVQDISGRILKVVNYDLPVSQINTSDLKSGVYFIKLTNKEGASYLRKFLKN